MVDLPASPVPRTSILVMACAHGAELSRADSSLARSRVWLRTGTCSSLYIFSRSAAILRDASSASCELSSDLEPSLKQQHHRGALPCGESVSISRAARGERTDTSQTQGRDTELLPGPEIRGSHSRANLSLSPTTQPNKQKARTILKLVGPSEHSAAPRYHQFGSTF